MSTSLFVGIDVGGTTSRVLAEEDPGGGAYERTGPGANLQRAGSDATAEVLATAITGAAEHFGSVHHLYICAGVSGAGRTDEARTLAELCRDRLGALQVRQLEIVHDGLIALHGAFAGKSGAILIVGTGSLVLIRSQDGLTTRAGGWGSVLGDDGSGYAMGRAALRAVADAIDCGVDTALWRTLRESHALESRDDLIRAIYRHRLPLQELAPIVLDLATKGDEEAGAIVEKEGRALIQQLVRALRPNQATDRRVAFIGGLAQNAYYRSVLTEQLERQVPQWSSVEPLESPVRGALRRARALGRSLTP